MHLQHSTISVSVLIFATHRFLRLFSKFGFAKKYFRRVRQWLTCYRDMWHFMGTKVVNISDSGLGL